MEDYHGNHTGRRPYPAAPDYEFSVHDYLRLLIGKQVKSPEPLARSWMTDGYDFAQVRAATGMTSSDFGSVLEAGLGVLLQESFGEARQGIDAVSRTVELPDYKPASLGQVGIAAPREYFEEAGLANRLPFEVSDGESGVLRTFGGRVAFSKPVASVYSAEIARAVAGYGEVFALLELQIMAAVLEASSPATGSGNIDTTGIAVATTALRNQTNASGQKVNLPISALLVPPELEVNANAIKVLTGMNYAVVVNPFLTSSSVWYAVGPATASPITRLILRGSPLPRAYINPNRGQESGPEYAAYYDFNFLIQTALPGLVKMS